MDRKIKKTNSRSKILIPKSRLDVAKENKLRKSSSIKKLNIPSKSRKKEIVRKLRKVALVLGGVMLLIGVIGGIRVFAYLQDINSQLPTPESVFPEQPVASEIYDRNGERLRRIFNEYNSDPVDISQVPDTVKWAFLAAEDIDFYTHQGFDLVGLVRCGIQNVISSEIACGGSTITQQLVKITAPGIGNAVTIERKIKELLLAIRVEQQYDKDQILEMYLRVAPFGSNIYGVKTASNFYFGKELKDLSLAEASILAAVIQDPIVLSPTLSLDPEGKEKLRVRQEYILEQLREKKDKINNQIRENLEDDSVSDLITDQLIDEALAVEVAYIPPKFSDGKAGHFVDYVIEKLTQGNYKNGEEPFTREELQNGGYKIYTSLDYSIQQIAESYVLQAIELAKGRNMANAAVMTINAKTGEIIAMMGSKSYSAPDEGCDANGINCTFNGQVNIFRTPQSPGSTNKPLGYYLAFKEGKLFTGSVLPDIPLKITDPAGNLYEPKNWDLNYAGLDTAATMLRNSRNIPAVQVVQMVGVENYVNTAKSLGYTSYTGQYGQAVILGGVDVFPDEHVQAFTVFANNGDLVQLMPILKILDKDGNEIYKSEVKKEAKADPQGVYLVNQSLINNESISPDGRDMAAKTGTSEDARDAWLMTWSPDMINLAWGGNNNNTPTNEAFSFYVLSPWMRNYVRDLSGAEYFKAATPFTRPGFVYEGGRDCNDTGCLGLTRGWLINDRTPERDIIIKKIRVCTDQQNRLARPIDEAMGLAMDAEYPYFKMPVKEWQDQLDKWMANNKADGALPNGGPSQPCTVDRSGGVSGPFFSFTSISGSSVSSINIKGGIYSNTGTINAVSFYLDNDLIPSCTTPSYQSFDITCDISSLGLGEGEYTFYASASDTSGKTNDSSNINVTIGDGVSSNFQFTNLPPTPLTWGTNVGITSYNIDIQYNSGNLNNVVLHQLKNGADSVVGTMSPIGGNRYRISWGTGVPNESATYKFYVTADIESSTGSTTSAQSSDITVNGI